MPNHPHKPTGEGREQVRAMAGYGLPQADIAVVMGVSKPTLRKYYPEELAQGSIQATAKVAESLYNNAVKRNNVTAQIFWMKNRAGWADVRKEELSGELVIKWQK